MGRRFERISFKQFAKDIRDDKQLYDSYNLPLRTTKNAAGYDFESLIDFDLKPGENIKIPLGIKVYMEPDEVFFLLVRSSMGFKYNVRMCNQVGVIDADYVDNSENEGHMWIKIYNEGEKVFSVKKGDKIAQGIFIKYLKTDDDISGEERKGGFGSTNKEE